MMRSSPSFPLSLAAVGFGLVALLSLHCGGRVDGEAPLVTDCPSDTSGTCSSGATCTQHVPDCSGGTTPNTCSCETGSWKCPILAGCPNPCANPAQGRACAIEGLFCKDLNQPSCDKPTNDGCTCSQGKFVCSATICNEPPPLCPPASTITEGGSCSGSATCGGTLYCPKGGSVGINFDCVNGHWQMWESIVDPCQTIDPDDGGIVIVDAGGKKGG
ncbi:hypothetical protein BH09MYX1_BH09MYX1_60910 [soil metagenome]